MPYYQTGKGKLHYQVHGKGTPLLLIPPFGYTMTLFDQLRNYLVEHFTVITVDLRGTGYSEHKGMSISLALLVQDLRSLIQYLGLGELSVYGLGAGGFLAQMLAAEESATIRELILDATSIGGAHAAPIPQHVLDLLFRLTQFDPDIARELALAEVGAAYPSAVKEAVALMDRHMNRENYEQLLLAYAAYQGEKYAKYIKAETLILVGEACELYPVAEAKGVSAAIPHGRLEVMEGGFLRVLTHPRVLAERILALI